jgi:prefoldin subunit 1
MIMSQQQLKVSDMQIDQLKRQMIHARLVDKELMGLSAETRTYEGVGRMYVYIIDKYYGVSF